MRKLSGSPAAGIAIKKVLLDEKKSLKVFAKEINLTYSYVSQIISGSKTSPATLKRMCEHAGVRYIDTKM